MARGNGTGPLDVIVLSFLLADVLEFCHRAPFGVPIHRAALDQHSEIDAMRVELGPIDTGEFALSVDQHAAAAAHASAVDHDRVEADNGVDILFPRHLGYR